MENMLLICGIWMIILPKIQWNILKDNSWVRIYSSILGIYTLLITIISRFFISKINDNFFLICFVLLLVLNILLLKIKVKSEKSNLSKIMVLVVSICIVLALFILYLDIKEIYSSIIILTATTIILFVPYNKIKRKKNKG